MKSPRFRLTPQFLRGGESVPIQPVRPAAKPPFPHLELPEASGPGSKKKGQVELPGIKSSSLQVLAITIGNQNAHWCVRAMLQDQHRLHWMARASRNFDVEDMPSFLPSLF